MSASVCCHGPSRHAKDEEAFIAATCTGHLDEARKLLAKDNSLARLRTKEGNTPLMMACERVRPEMIHLLLQTKVEADEENHHGDVALMRAAENGHIDGVMSLITEGRATVDHANHEGKTALFFAARNGHTKVARILVESGADVNHADKLGGTPLIAACCGGHEPTARLLLNAGAAINTKTTYGVSPLSAACQLGAAPVVRLCLEFGADTAALDHSATQSREVTEMLAAAAALASDGTGRRSMAAREAAEAATLAGVSHDSMEFVLLRRSGALAKLFEKMAQVSERERAGSFTAAQAAAEREAIAAPVRQRAEELRRLRESGLRLDVPAGAQGEIQPLVSGGGGAKK